MNTYTLTVERITRSYVVYKDNSRVAGTIVYVPREEADVTGKEITVTVETGSDD